MIINGKKISQEIIAELKQTPAPKKFLAVFLVGDDSASASFVEQKEKTARELGVDLRMYRYPADISQDKLRREVGKVTAHKTCGGAIVQLPLPKHLNRHYVLNAIPREKDVDVLGERALGAFYTGRNPIMPPPVATVETIIRLTNLELKNLKTAVVGLGFLIGKPIAEWLKGKTKELYCLDEKSDLTILKEADLVISGTGHAGLIRPDMLKQGAGVIDFGYAKGPGGVLLGDFDSSKLTNVQTNRLAFYTPTPGGTGPIVVALLFRNFYTLNR
ncbi:MAG: bifunctional 5,10-methylenetetrahydrofolate dehydrogenase/5,10-methenyltetrahydrofolate cyclohydrolase [Patescibacteria group bacterium]